MAKRRWCLSWCWRVLIRGKGRRLFQAKDTVWVCVGKQDLALYTQHMANNLARLGYVVWVILWWNIKLEIYFRTMFWKALNVSLWGWVLLIRQGDFWRGKWSDSCIRKITYNKSNFKVQNSHICTEFWNLCSFCT